jgi:hypothetical protein
VRVEERPGAVQAVVQLHLQLHRVGLQVDQPAGGGVLRQRLGAAVQVDDQVGAGEQRRELAADMPSTRSSLCTAWYAQRPAKPKRRITRSR